MWITLICLSFSMKTRCQDLSEINLNRLRCGRTRISSLSIGIRRSALSKTCHEDSAGWGKRPIWRHKMSRVKNLTRKDLRWRKPLKKSHIHKDPSVWIQCCLLASLVSQHSHHGCFVQSLRSCFMLSLWQCTTLNCNSPPATPTLVVFFASSQTASWTA